LSQAFGQSRPSLCDLTGGKQGSSLYAVRRRQQSGGLHQDSIRQSFLEKSERFLWRARQ
jgi:hypothetical protein